MIITSKTRSNGIGQALMNKIEEYFKLNNCEYVLVDVFAYNENAINFYNKKGYHTILAKKVDGTVTNLADAFKATGNFK